MAVPRNFELVVAKAEAQLPSLPEAIRVGLGQPPGQRHIPCRFLYDERGSQLFEQICELPEYYPTRTEISILEAHAEEMVATLEPGAALVELGSGSERKIRPLLAAVLEKHGSAHYIPIDISPSILEESADHLFAEFGSALRVTAIAGEYRAGLQALSELGAQQPLGLWLGGSIGNMQRSEAARFLNELQPQLPEIIVGIDLRKDRAVLVQAYDDPQGVTADFSLNVLDRISRELQADFDRDGFRHVADYHTKTGVVEIELESQRSQVVRIAQIDLEVEFAVGERIHLEDSIKYSRSEIDTLARDAGYLVRESWLDPGDQFSVNSFTTRTE